MYRLGTGQTKEMEDNACSISESAFPQEIQNLRSQTALSKIDPVHNFHDFFTYLEHQKKVEQL